VQLPLYTIWTTGTVREQAFAALHCTTGDILVALTALTLALIMVGDEGWPTARFPQVAATTLIFGGG